MFGSSQDAAFEDAQLRFQLLQTELAKLRDIWSRTRQSRGGVVALRGFHFQMLTALNRLVFRWVDAEIKTQNEPFILPLWIEALSDWTEIGPAIVACQVKLTQGSSEVSEALTEFWLIEKLAKDNCPDLTTTLQYRILSQKPKLKDVAGAIARWFPRDESDNAVVDIFKGKISAVITPEPESEILSLLTNRLNAEDPLGHVQRWLGLLFSACDTNLGFAPALRQVWNDLQKLRHADQDHSPVGYLWTSHDRPPDAVVPGPVLTGQRPAVWHLREGYFANRKDVYEKLVEAAESWLSKPGGRSSGPKLRFFWIGGRSGTGKSVALLHGLTGLQERGSRYILWLESNLDLLPDAVRWCRPLLRQQRTVIIGVDDPYGPTHQATALSILGRVNSELLTLQQEGPDISLPYFICSGPSEQRVRFKQDVPDLVEVEHSDLPLETRADLRELWEWFCIRSGKKQEIPYQEGEDVLLVQLFFEWRTGEPLLEFAARFKRRIEVMEGTRNGPLSAFLARLIALNRIYAGYPSGCLRELRSDPQFEVGFNRLSEQEHHLRIEDERIGLWFAHPHLAHAIYDAWFHPDEDEPIRRGHLVEAVFDALKFGESIQERTVPLSAIARLFAPGTDEALRQRLPTRTASALLSEIYRQLKMQFPQMPVWLLPVWIQIQATVPDIKLAPSPLQDALGALIPSRTAEPGMKLLCHRLIRHCEKLSETFPGLLVRIRDFLVLCQEWRDWPLLARAYCLETRRPDLVPVVEDWLLKHAEDSFAFSLLQAALRVSRDEGIIEAGYRWLRTIRFDARMWSFAWEDLYYSCPSNEKLVKLGRQWLGTVDANVEGWGFVWQRLHRDFADDVDLIGKAYEWLQRADPAHNEWAFVWQDLRLARPDDSVLPLKGRQWLTETSMHHGSWGSAER